MYAMILAAGFGTRLGDLSAERPKPMFPVCNHPLVSWATRYCVHSGVDTIVVNLHHLGQQISQTLGDGSKFGATIRYSAEETILGTGGGIKAMARLMGNDETVVAINGKIIADIDLGAALALHRASNALATMVLCSTENPERWGAIGAGESGRLCRLLDLRRGDEPSTDYMFTGVHLLEPEFIEAIDDGPCCVIRTAYRRLFQAGAPLSAYVHRGYFHEHSTPARYLQGNVNLLEGVVSPAHAPGPLRGVSPRARVAASASVIDPVLIGDEVEIGAGARIGPQVVLGDGVRVAGGVRVERCVAWSGAAITEHRRGALISATQTVSAR